MTSGSPSAVRRVRHLGRSLRLALAAALGLGLMPAAALGSSVGLSPASVPVLEYRADPGETNSLIISPYTAGYVQVVDPGAVPGVSPVAPCVAGGGPDVALCPDSSIGSMDVALGDGGDSAEIQSSLPTTLHGELGDDVLIGGSNADELFGDDGDDVLEGAIGADLVHGGPGVDVAYYRGRDDPVKVTLDGITNDGEVAENDNVLPDVEGVDGGDAADWLVGNDAANTLSGKLGDDLLEGRGGSDVLDGWDGDDVILAAGDGGDLVACGPGVDRVYADVGDTVAADCERVYRSGASPRPNPPPPSPPPAPPAVPQPVVFLTPTKNGTLTETKSGAVPVGLVCFAPKGKACRGTISLQLTIHVPVAHRRSMQAAAARHKRRRVNVRLARSRFSVPAGRTKRVPLALVASARRRLDSCKRLKVRIVIVSHDARGESKTVTRRATIVRAKGRRAPEHRYLCS